jgi:hypothetical protein
MNPLQTVCNYALLRYLPYPETEEFVNVGVLISCLQPCLLDFKEEPEMPARAKALFPLQDAGAFAAATGAFTKDMRRAKGEARNPRTCKMLFSDLVRPRESTLRFGEIRTIVTDNPHHLADELFRRYVRMEALPLRSSPPRSMA